MSQRTKPVNKASEYFCDFCKDTQLETRIIQWNPVKYEALPCPHCTVKLDIELDIELPKVKRKLND